MSFTVQINGTEHVVDVEGERVVIVIAKS